MLTNLRYLNFLIVNEHKNLEILRLVLTELKAKSVQHHQHVSILRSLKGLERGDDAILFERLAGSTSSLIFDTQTLADEHLLRGDKLLLLLLASFSLESDKDILLWYRNARNMRRWSDNDRDCLSLSDPACLSGEGEGQDSGEGG